MRCSHPTPHTRYHIPHKGTKYIAMCEVVGTFLLLSVFPKHARRSRARVGALAWVGVGARVTVGRRPLAICQQKNTKNTKNSIKNLYKVKYTWYLIWYDLWDKAGKGASQDRGSRKGGGGVLISCIAVVDLRILTMSGWSRSGFHRPRCVLLRTPCKADFRTLCAYFLAYGWHLRVSPFLLSGVCGWVIG